MQIEIKERTKVTAKIYGRDLSLTKPTVGQIEAMQEKIANDKNKSMVVMKEFALGLGLPADVANGMEVEHFQQLIEELCGTKKK